MGALLMRPSGAVSLIVISLAIAGAGIGAGVPQLIADELRPPAYRLDTTSSIDVLGRLAQIIGGICGRYVALRAIWLSCVLGVIAAALYLLHSAVSHVFGGARYSRAQFAGETFSELRIV